MPITIYIKNRDAIPGYRPKRDFKKVNAKATREYKGSQYEIDGVVMELFPIRVLAEALDRTTRTVRELEKTGHIPTPLFHIPQKNGLGKTRLYSAAQIVNINRLFIFKYRGVKFNHGAGSHDEFFSALKTVFYQREIVVNEEGALVIPREQLSE